MRDSWGVCEEPNRVRSLVAETHALFTHHSGGSYSRGRRLDIRAVKAKYR